MANWNTMHNSMYKNSFKTSREYVIYLRSEGSKITYKSQNNLVQTQNASSQTFKVVETASSSKES